MFPRELECQDCGLHVTTTYRRNEFTDLDEDTLHLLRIFVACEGRIRDMERVLGVSYPTVKTRLAGLKDALGFNDEPDPPPPPVPPEPPTPPEPPAPPEPPHAAAQETQAEEAPGADPLEGGDDVERLSPRHPEEVLSDLEAGIIDYEQAMAELKRTS